MFKEPGCIPCHRSFEGWASELCPTILLPVAVQEETRELDDPWVVLVPLEPLLVDSPQTFFLVGPQGRLLQQGVEDTTKDPAGHPLAVNHVHDVQEAQQPGGHGVGQERVQRLPAPCQVGRLAQRCGQSPRSPAPQVSVGVVSPISQTFTTDLLGVVVRQPPFLAVALLIPLGDEQDKGPLGAISSKATGWPPAVPDPRAQRSAKRASQEQSACAVAFSLMQEQAMYLVTFSSPSPSKADQDLQLNEAVLEQGAASACTAKGIMNPSSSMPSPRNTGCSCIQPLFWGLFQELPPKADQQTLVCTE